MSSYTRQQLEDWLKTIKIPADSRVLDVGGSQNPVDCRIVQENIFSSDFKILDLEQPHECKRKPDIICDLNKSYERWMGHNDIYVDEPGCGDDEIVKIDRLPVIENKVEFEYCWEFNVAFCLEVSEYWYDPLTALRNISYFLKEGGELYISFHFIYPVHNPVEQDYLRYTPKGAEKLLQEAGFEIEEMKPRLESENGVIVPAFKVEGMRLAKEYDRHNWTGCLIKAKKL